MLWGPEKAIDLAVQLWDNGPLDPLGVNTMYDITDRVESLSIVRGRSDELSAFGSGSCTFRLRNNDRLFDPALSRVVLHMPGAAGATASTPDHADLVAADIDVRVCFSMDDWSPGGFGQFVVGQWPNVAGNNGWVVTISPTGFPGLSWSTDGTNQVTRTSTVGLAATPAGDDLCLGWTLARNNGAGQHVVTFYTSPDGGSSWDTLDTVTTAGTTSVFNSTAVLAVGDVLPLAGQVRWVDYRASVGGPRRAYPRFDDQPPGTTSFTDSTGRVWTVNGTASIGYDDDASPLAEALRPLRKVVVVAEHVATGSTWFLFTGWVDEWPTTWAKTTGSVEVTAYDFISVLANVDITDIGFTLDVDRLDFGYLGGDMEEQLTGDRVETLLSMAGFGPAQFRVIDRGTVMMPATDFRGDILSACQAAEVAEAGFFYIDGAGVVRFLDAHSRTEKPDLSTIQATFRDGDYSGFDADLSLKKVWNDVTFSRPDGEPQVFKDDWSVSQYGHRSRSETIDVLTDGEAYARAEFFVARFGRPRIRPGALTIKPARRNRQRLFDPVMSLDLLHRVAVEQTPVGTGPTNTIVGLLEQVTHTITKDDWVTTLALSQADVDDSPGYMTLDDDVLGVLDGFPLVY